MPSAATSLPPHSETGKTVLAAVNATIAYLVGYLVVQGAYQLATVSMAARLGIRGKWQLGQVQFHLADGQWWRTAVLAVYGAGPLVCAGLGLGALWWFWKLARRQRGLLKQLLLWVMLHACNLSAGVLVADTVTQSGAWYVPSWLFLAGNTLNIGVAVLAGVVQMGLGVLAARLFLQSHDSITLMEYYNRRRLLWATVVVPWLASNLLLAAFYFPAQSSNEQLHGLTMLLLLGPLYGASSSGFFDSPLEQPGRPRLARGLGVALALALLLARVLLGRGISFG